MINTLHYSFGISNFGRWLIEIGEHKSLCTHTQNTLCGYYSMVFKIIDGVIQYMRERGQMIDQ